jgi:hypothetical protein
MEGLAMTLPTVTVDDLKQCTLQRLCHLNMGSNGSGWAYSCKQHPRLVVSDHFDKRTRKTTRTFLVDNERCLNLEDVAFRLSNPPKYVLVDEASDVPNEAWEPQPSLRERASKDPEQGSLL